MIIKVIKIQKLDNNQLASCAIVQNKIRKTKGETIVRIEEYNFVLSMKIYPRTNQRRKPALNLILKTVGNKSCKKYAITDKHKMVNFLSKN